MNARAASIARLRTGGGIIRSTGRSSWSTSLNTGPHAERYGPRVQSRTRSGCCRNSSRTCTPRGFRARGRSAASTTSGTTTVRDQYDMFQMLKKNQRGSSTISTGITGVPRHGISPYSASWNRVNTLARSAPPAWRIASRARRMCGASGSSPIALSAKYALTLADRSNRPSWYSGQPTCGPWIRRR